MMDEQLQALGRALRDMREHFSLSIEEVATRLHIRGKYLLALEEGRMDELPGKVYAKGYLQSYADFLGVDAQDWLNRFTPAPKETPRYYLPDAALATQKPGKPVVILCALLIVGLYGLWYLFQHRDEPSIESAVEPVPSALEQEVKDREMLRSMEHPCVSEGNVRGFPPCYGSGDVTDEPSILEQVPE